MMSRRGGGWQTAVAIAGLAIVGVVLVAPRAREAASLVAAPSAAVAPSSKLAIQGSQSTQATDQQSADTSAPPAAPAAPPQSGTSAPAAPSAGLATGAHAIGGTSLSGVTGALPVVGKTLFSDNFATDPLTTGLPTGWQLTDTTKVVTDTTQSVAGGLPVLGAVTGSGGGGLPILGGLLGGLLGGSGSATSTVTNLLPSVVMDGTHVLSRSTNSWSILSAGSPAMDFSVSADMKPMSSDLGFVGVAGRFLDASNYLTCGIRNGQSLQLWQVVGGQAKLLSAKPLSIASGVFHTVNMAMKGSQVSCAMDGGTLLSSTGATLTNGKLGLIAVGDLASEIGNVKAATLP
ncbi:MAG TPA: hypothetical protein VGO86_05510 [Candidatus Dormibacteraeota bacterium]